MSQTGAWFTCRLWKRLRFPHCHKTSTQKQERTTTWSKAASRHSFAAARSGCRSLAWRPRDSLRTPTCTCNRRPTSLSHAASQPNACAVHFGSSSCVTTFVASLGNGRLLPFPTYFLDLRARRASWSIHQNKIVKTTAARYLTAVEIDERFCEQLTWCDDEPPERTDPQKRVTESVH